MRKSFLAILAWFAAHQALASGIDVRNGGDVLIINEEVKLFDVVECEESFSPSDVTNTENGVAEAFKIISAQLSALRPKLKMTADYLNSTFSHGRALWCFVGAELKEVPDEGMTSIVVEFNKLQVAVNQGDVVKIRRDLWDQMNLHSRAALLMHEALWTAVQSEHVHSGTVIRRLTNLLLNPEISKFTAYNIAHFIKEFIKNDSSKLSALADYDLLEGSGMLDFKIEEVIGDRSVDLLVTYTGAGSFSGYRISSLNPNSLYRNVIVDRNRRVFVDLSENSTQFLHSAKLDDLCGRMNFAGETGWRLPTDQEIHSLYLSEIFQLSYVPMQFQVRTFAAGDSQTETLRYNSKFVFPISTSLVLITSQARLIDVSNRFRDVTDLYRVDLSRGNSSNYSRKSLIYPRYICIKKPRS